MKLDKRKKMIAVFDTETIGVVEPLIYDLGITITDKKGCIYAQGNWIIKEIWEQKDLMNSAYYSWKIPIYEKMIKENLVQVVPWLQAKEEYNRLLKDYNVTVISAYNLQFDIGAMKKTHSSLVKDKSLFLTKKIKETWDIWGLAVQTVLSQKSYKRIAEEKGWFTPKGNYLTNAEVAYRYITNDHYFEESHTALHDTEIETKILAHCLKQNVKLPKGKGIFANPWKFIQN